MTNEFIFYTMFWIVFLLTAKAAETLSVFFRHQVGSSRNQEFACELIVKRELEKHFKK